ncbi:MAG: putative lipid II flippase FtsW [Acidimicrobiales bacterium]
MTVLAPKNRISDRRTQAPKVAGDNAGKRSGPAKIALRRQNQAWLGALVGCLVVVGLVMVLSASTVESLAEYGSPWVIFERQVLWVIIGTIGALLAWRADYRQLRRFAAPAFVGCLALLLVVLIPGVGQTVAGSSRWIGRGSFRIQPSELAKLGLVLFGADLLARRSGDGKAWGPAVRPILIALTIAGTLILVQPDMGTALILGCIGLGMLYAAGVPGKPLAGIIAGSGLLALLLGWAEPYRRARILSFLNPWVHRSGNGYQAVQSLAGFASGHLVGVGLGASNAKWGFLPNAYTDFIFSIIGEEVGLVGSLAVVALFVGLAVVGLKIAAQAGDKFGSLLASGITCWLVAQTVFNMGAAIGMLPVTGVPLPFISYGGSSLVIEMFAIGLLGSVASRAHDHED